MKKQESPNIISIPFLKFWQVQNNSLLKIPRTKKLNKMKLYLPDAKSHITSVNYRAIGSLEQDLLYIYLLILSQKKLVFPKINTQSLFSTPRYLLEKTMIETDAKELLDLLGKTCGGRNYKSLYSANLNLNSVLFQWVFYNRKTNKPMKGAANLINFNIDSTTNKITVDICVFYLLYLLRPIRKEVHHIIEKPWTKYTLLNLHERFILKQNLDRYIHERLSHDVYPIYKCYTIKGQDIFNEIKTNHWNQLLANSSKWQKRTRFKISESIKRICNQLDNWELVNVSGRGARKTFFIRRQPAK